MKDTFYFSHDYNARNDIKIKRLIAKHNYLGYGLFWAIIEDLYNNANALPLDYECIAFDLRADIETVKSIINDFDLFTHEDGFFGSLSIQKRLDERNLKSIKARESALNRWNKSERNANALPTQSDSNAIKERKEKEIKGNESKDFLLEKETKENLGNSDFNDSVKTPEPEKEKSCAKKENLKPPDLAEFLDYAKETYQNELKRDFSPFDFAVRSKYESWINADWKDGNGKQIKNWKSKLNNTIPHLKPIYNGTNNYTAGAANGNQKPAGKVSARTVLAQRLNAANATNSESGNITIDIEAQ